MLEQPIPLYFLQEEADIEQNLAHLLIKDYMGIIGPQPQILPTKQVRLLIVFMPVPLKFIKAQSQKDMLCLFAV